MQRVILLSELAEAVVLIGRVEVVGIACSEGAGAGTEGVG